jgi:riboflavin transporter FmnP
MVNDPTPPSATREAVNGLCQASYVIGIVAAIGLLIPPGLIIGPPAGLAAVILGMAGLSDAPEGSKSRTRAITGITLGAVALFVELSLIFLFRHVIWRAVGPLL